MVSVQPRIRILIVDDEEIIRYGLKAIFQCEPSLEVVGEAANGQEAMDQIEMLNPDIVLMDIHMPLMNGIIATEKIGQKYPDIKVLILTTSMAEQHLRETLKNKAIGYMLKRSSPQELINVIQNAYKGYLQFDPYMGQHLCQYALN